MSNGFSNQLPRNRQTFFYLGDDATQYCRPCKAYAHATGQRADSVEFSASVDKIEQKVLFLKP